MTDQERHTLVLEHSALVKSVALRLMRRLPQHVELNDLIGAGTLGLVDAARRFDPSKGVPFGAFVRRRIQGAMLDELRSGDWIPRAERRALREDGVAVRVQVPLDQSVWNTMIDPEESIYERLVRLETARRALTGFSQLSRMERRIVIDSYHHGVYLKEIGRHLGLSESRVSQLRTHAVEILRHATL